MLQVGLNNRWVMKPAWSAGLPPRENKSGREEKNLGRIEKNLPGPLTPSAE
jgi:hypothetical protein